jgi:two-component system chemotaxis sensor kinase CheA
MDELTQKLKKASAGEAVEPPAKSGAGKAEAPEAEATPKAEPKEAEAPPAAEPKKPVPERDPEDVAVFRQTVGQQIDNIELALSILAQDPGNKDYVDGLYRSLVTVQNSSGYMDLEELKLTAERTAGLVEQARTSDMDFSLMLDILKQECGIIQDLVDKELAAMEELPAEPEPPAGDEVPEEPQAPEEPPEESAPEPDAGPEEKPDKEAGARQKAERAAAASGTKVQKPKTSTTIRVDHEKLDHLMNLIGELIINRNRFSMITRGLEEEAEKVDLDEVVLNLTESTYAMARISDDLQDTIMKVRMVPVSSVFSRFPRLVRDLSRKSGKQVELVTEGEDTELDKSVIEVIGDPLVHLIRNSVDHGLENEEDRKAAGKEPMGKIWLRAYHKGNSVAIEVQDDGRGIDPEKMRQVAVKKGVIGADEAKNLDDREAVELIFAPGFSAADKITDISGRGVGMDVVRNNIKELKGSVGVQSEVGKGTRFTLTLPLTLAIIDALMVTVSGESFAIPLDAVSETTKIETARLTEVNKRKAVTLRGEVLGIIELSELLDMPSNGQERDVLPIVVIHENQRRLGLVVDRLLERQEVVIKSMGEYLGDREGISGATIMGDGSVVLILDPHEIHKLATAKSA